MALAITLDGTATETGGLLLAFLNLRLPCRSTAKYRMQNFSCLYPMTLNEAADVAKRIKLDPYETYIEPSRFSGYLLDNCSAAIAFRMTFTAKPWSTKCDDLFFLYVETSSEVSSWIESCGYDYRAVEIVAIQFRSDEDRNNFEAAIWPHRATEGVEIS